MSADFEFSKDDPPALTRDELAYRMEWQNWRGNVQSQMDTVAEISELRMAKHTLEIKEYMKQVIDEHEDKEMSHLKKINTFMWQTKVAGAMAVTALVIATQTSGLF